MTKRTHKAARKFAQRPYIKAAADIGEACYWLHAAGYSSYVLANNLRMGFMFWTHQITDCKEKVRNATRLRLWAAHNGRYLP